MASHPAILKALEDWRAIRAEYQDHLENQVARADHDCHGYLLNDRGRSAGVSAYSLFYGPAVRVAAYASEELVQWFAENGRVTFSEYEAQRGLVPGGQWGQLIEEWDCSDEQLHLGG